MKQYNNRKCLSDKSYKAGTFTTVECIETCLLGGSPFYSPNSNYYAAKKKGAVGDCYCCDRQPETLDPVFVSDSLFDTYTVKNVYDNGKIMKFFNEPNGFHSLDG